MIRRADKIRARLGASDLFPECEERWLRENAFAVFAVERGLMRYPDILNELSCR